MIDHPYFEKLGLKIDENSFKNCYVNIGRIKGGYGVFNIRPEMGDWVEFRDHPKKFIASEPSNSEIITYIVAMYDPQSPFRNLEYDVRKRVSGLYAGFKVLESGAFSERGQSIMNCEEPIVGMMIVRYCAITRGLEYTTYREFERRYHELILRDPDKSITEIEKDRKILASYRDEFLAQDKSPELQKTFYAVVTEEEKKLRALRPEYQEEFFYNQIQMKREEIEEAYRKTK